ncbi:Lysine biosynthesis regulatory protein LYS14 [Nakaseomyces bracarensis]|uniref:Lysine biosynthesis regulatory protein LYS14 n=1 Tax=Nakaseomyces bracarensis TaxID=273131 RepID=A0ABR4NY13_9SACH
MLDSINLESEEKSQYPDYYLSPESLQSNTPQSRQLHQSISNITNPSSDRVKIELSYSSVGNTPSESENNGSGSGSGTGNDLVNQNSSVISNNNNNSFTPLTVHSQYQVDTPCNNINTSNSVQSGSNSFSSPSMLATFNNTLATGSNTAVSKDIKPNIHISSMVKDSEGNIIKRKYSRNGCVECKRRRMKCDESKPKCWQCTRLNRDCVYILNPRNKKRKKAKNKSRDHDDDDDSMEQKMINGNIVSGNGNLTDAQSSSISELNRHTPETPLSNNESETKNNDIPNVLLNADLMDGFDANLLMQNLNDMVNMKLHDSVLINDNDQSFDIPDFDFPELLAPTTSSTNSVPISFLVNNVITFNSKLASFRLGGVHDKYLQVFYYDCLDSIAPFFQDQANPLRDIILSFARNEPYLLSAILATGASILHRKENKLEDERNYCAYLSRCLALLNEQFQNEANVIQKIEPIILTVIMLAWDCIYTMDSQWRSHLKGVTDLFKKIAKGNSSKVLNVAKCWFKVMETFAGVSTVLGGSLTEEADIDAIFDPYDFQYVDSLKFLNIMTPLNEFNLVRGHKEDFDLVIAEVIKSLNAIRKVEKKEFSSNEQNLFSKRNLDYLLWSSNDTSELTKSALSYFKTQKIIVQIDKQLEYEFIDKTGVIPPNHQSHPKNSGIHDNAIDLVTLRNGEEIAISWYDISHQTQVLSFLLIVLLKLLGIPKESLSIQNVVKRIMSYFKFLDSENPPMNPRTCYSNFSVLIAGLNAMDEETRDIVRSYYKLNGSRFSRLTEHNLNRLERVWYGKESDPNYELADQDVLTW